MLLLHVPDTGYTFPTCILIRVVHKTQFTHPYIFVNNTIPCCVYIAHTTPLVYDSIICWGITLLKTSVKIL